MPPVPPQVLRQIDAEDRAGCVLALSLASDHSSHSQSLTGRIAGTPTTFGLGQRQAEADFRKMEGTP